MDCHNTQEFNMFLKQYSISALKKNVRTHPCCKVAKPVSSLLDLKQPLSGAFIPQTITKANQFAREILRLCCSKLADVQHGHRCSFDSCFEILKKHKAINTPEPCFFWYAIDRFYPQLRKFLLQYFCCSKNFTINININSHMKFSQCTAQTKLHSNQAEMKYTSVMSVMACAALVPSITRPMAMPAASPTTASSWQRLSLSKP